MTIKATPPKETRNPGLRRYLCLNCDGRVAARLDVTNEELSGADFSLVDGLQFPELFDPFIPSTYLKLYMRPEFE